MEQQYKNIIVAIDGSRESDLAFERALSIASKYSSTLHLVNVIDPRSIVTLEAYDESISTRAKNMVLELLEEYKQKAIDEKLNDVQIVIEYGSPKVKIPNEISQQLHADLIICGATGLNAIEKFFIGSVSENIVRHAQCDVLIVRDLA